VVTQERENSERYGCAISHDCYHSFLSIVKRCFVGSPLMGWAKMGSQNGETSFLLLSLGLWGRAKVKTAKHLRAREVTSLLEGAAVAYLDYAT